MSHYKPYPAYKDSGVDWLGRVPEHWCVRKLKLLAALTTGITPPTDNYENYVDEGFPWIRPEDIDELGHPTLASKFLSEIGKDYVRQISEEASLICCIGTIGKIGYVDRVVSTNQQITSAEFYACGRFFFYALQASKQALDAASAGNVIRILNTDRLGNIFYPQPPSGECYAIATHLDRETARIDALIEKKTRFIELLREKRQALITHAVTKGLDPNVKMKDSGVEWLGDVPEHWDVRSVKTLARLDGGAGFPDDEQGQSDNPIPFFKVAELANGLSYTANTVTEETAKRLGAKIFPPSTLVFAKVGAALLLNRRCLLERPACLDNNMMALLPGSFEPQWLFWVFSTLDMGLIANPGAVPSINQEQVGNIRLGVPTSAEQRNIAQQLDRETASIDALKGRTERSIELLKERRASLITAAVTGQIDLREVG